ncbi:MAG: Bacterial alpha-L-rhamnosidase [Microbacteriaceae bacterium]|nr:Bacterial alpha-L-rhamnosidase [Microbacteriaceae bacterium]
MTWHARMIAADSDFDGAPLLRREFTLDPGHGDVVSASLALSALGVVEAWLGGERVSDDLLTPGWTSYEWRLRYVTYDVTDLLDDTGVLALALGNGWYRGRLGWTGASALYGDTLGGFAQLDITFADGHVQTVATDESWSAGPSAVLENDLYNGETIDARRDRSAWLEPGFAASDWVGVHVLDFDTAELVPSQAPPVRAFDELAPVKIWTSPSGRTLVDFGQDLVGWVRVRVQGPAGSEVVLRHAEVLERDELGVRPLRSAKATDRYILSGGVDVFEPTFTFHGFRYAEVTGWPGELTAADLTAVAVGSQLERIGTFRSSDPLLNQLHQNVVWGMRGNFLSVPTDCPQRDERLGWTGDIAAFAPTSAFLFDVHDFLGDWLRDVDLEQSHHDGIIPFVVPDSLKYTGIAEVESEMESTAVWSDAGVWVPWALYQAYGDVDALEEQFATMAAHVRHVRSLLSPNGLWDTGFQFGDWLDPDAPPHEPIKAKADMGVVATVSAYRSTWITAEAARILGRESDAAEFAALAADLKRAFTDAYVKDGRVLSDATTAYALAIEFGILDEADRVAAGDRLSELVRESGYLVSTGFAGTPFICDALSSTGHIDDAYGLLMQQENPSWLYPVTMGATTIWERWDSMLPDGSINPGEMTSFNHYAFGAVADWMHRTIGGISALEPGYSRILLAPQPGGGLTSASASLKTPHGTVSVDWTIDGAGLHVDVEVPEGATAVLRLPGSEDVELGAGRTSRSVAVAQLESAK